MLRQNCYWWPHSLDCLHQNLSRNQTPRLMSSLQDGFTANCFDIYVKIATISLTRYHSYYFYFYFFATNFCPATIWEWHFVQSFWLCSYYLRMMASIRNNTCDTDWGPLINTLWMLGMRRCEKIKSGALGPKLSALTTWTQVTLLHFNLQSTQWVIDIKGYFVHRCHYVCVSVAF